MISTALDKLALCSSDPTCAEHRPAAHKDECALAGAVCRSCMLVAQTSCEQRNLYLDRALVTPTISTGGSALFGDRSPVSPVLRSLQRCSTAERVRSSDQQADAKLGGDANAGADEHVDA